MGKYDDEFFAEVGPDSRRSAERIVPIIIDLVRPRSVVDVGCGSGSWLAVFLRSGIGEVLGLDGDYVDRAKLEFPAGKFRAVDLEEPVRDLPRYDLAVSLEVAEHLSPERAQGFVADLVALAPTILFSAAVPGQGGTEHRNEQWQDYWAALFSEHGYLPVDCVRRLVWDDQGVQPWYAQNTLLYVSDAEPYDASDHLPLRIVHPRLYTLRTTRPLHLREVLAHARPALHEFVGKRLR